MKAKGCFRLSLGVAAAAASASIAQGHVETFSAQRQPLGELWTFEPVVVVSLYFTAALYAMGMRHMPRWVRRRALWMFLGLTILGLALISPVHQLGSWLFSVHMVQHELLMIVAAPLLILGRPEFVIPRALPVTMVRWTARLLDASGPRWSWKLMSSPIGAGGLHAAAIWTWHTPRLFEATFEREWIHAFQHLSFFGTALLFWYSIFAHAKSSRAVGWSLFNLFVTAVHTSVLGALITFAPRVLYRSYEATAPVWGMTALNDQQLGGVIMWVPGGLVYIIAALLLLRIVLRRTSSSQKESSAQDFGVSKVLIPSSAD